MKLIYSLYIMIGILILSLIPNAIDISKLLKELRIAEDYYYRYLFSQLLVNIFFIFIIILSTLFFIQLLSKISNSSKTNTNIKVLSLIISSFYLLLTILFIFSLITTIKYVKELNYLSLFFSSPPISTPLVLLEFFSYFFLYILFFMFFLNIEINFINKKTLSFISIIAISLFIILYLTFTIIVNIKDDTFNFSYMNKFKNGFSIISTIILYFAYLNFFISLYKLQKKEM